MNRITASNSNRLGSEDLCSALGREKVEQCLRQDRRQRIVQNCGVCIYIYSVYNIYSYVQKEKAMSHGQRPDLWFTVQSERKVLIGFVV